MLRIKSSQKKIETKTTTHWKCGKWRSYKFKVTATRCFGELLTIKGDHCHAIVPGKPEARQNDQKAAINAFKEAYPESSISGYYFHLRQSFKRKIADLGLNCFYQKNADFAVALKMIPALAFTPVAEVENAVELVLEEICHVLDKLKADTCMLEKTDQLTSYFQRNNIKGEKIGGNEKDATIRNRTSESKSRNVRGFETHNQRCGGMALGCVSIVSKKPPAYHIFGKKSFGCEQPKV